MQLSMSAVGLGKGLVITQVGARAVERGVILQCNPTGQAYVKVASTASRVSARVPGLQPVRAAVHLSVEERAAHSVSGAAVTSRPEKVRVENVNAHNLVALFNYNTAALSYGFYPKGLRGIGVGIDWPATKRASLVEAVSSSYVSLGGRNRTEDGVVAVAMQNVLQFVKYHGLGNDFLLVDNRDSETPKITPEQAMALCDRYFGVGGDGVIFVLPGTNGSDYAMRIYNSDGSEPEMCGNGIRCMARFVAELEGTTESRSYTINTLGGLIIPRLQDDGQVCVDMGPPILEAAKIPTTLSPSSKNGAVVNVPLSVDGKTWNVTCVSMGNPHCITVLDDTVVLDDLPLASIGPLFEHHAVFPARTNTEFIQVLSPSHIRMRVWERGAGATLACGTGACALVVASVLEGRTERKCLVELPGGPLDIEWREEDNHLYMTGPAQKVFAGTAFL